METKYIVWGIDLTRGQWLLWRIIATLTFPLWAIPLGLFVFIASVIDDLEGSG